jgi:hypothetical protein
MFQYLGALVKGFNKKYRNLFYDSGLEAALAKGLRGPVAVLEQK